MNETLLICTGLLPVLLIALAWRPHGDLTLLAAPIPALLAASLVPTGTELTLPWLLLGTQIGLDATARPFLVASATIWLAAGIYARYSLRDKARTPRFRAFFLLAMAGNFLLILASDAVTFYLGFSLMGLAAYGLVAHSATVSARHAARVYLAWTLFGEVLIFAAVLLLAVNASGLGFAYLRVNPPSETVMILLVLGFGIKSALPGLHLWLPLAYPAAPAAGAAVLSGAMINAGLLGWMRFLPIGEIGYADWGKALVFIGLAAAIYGVLFGLLQNRAKVVLAYSSISQMGLLTAAVGLALGSPSQAPALLLMATLYAVHHGLAKGGMFLAVDAHAGRCSSYLSYAVLVLFALSLAGAPLTSGGMAKAAYKTALPEDWIWLGNFMALSTLATTLLMARFLVLAWRQRRDGPALDARALLALLLPIGGGFALILAARDGIPAFTPDPASYWPLALGSLVAAWLLWRRSPALSRLAGSVPPGDLPALICRRLRWRLPAVQLQPPRRLAAWTQTGISTRLDRAESRLRSWSVAGSLWLLVMLLLALALFTGTGLQSWEG